MRKLFLIGAAVLFSLLGCVALIKKMAADGATYDEMRRATGACHMTIYRIVKHLRPYADSALPAPERLRTGREGPHKKTSKHVNHIREMVAAGATYDDIRKATGLSLSTIWKIVKRRTPFADSHRELHFGDRN